VTFLHFQAPSGADFLTLVVRIARGSAHNFAIRVSDWFASFVMLSFGVVLIYCPWAFGESRWYGLLEQIANPLVWGVICGSVGLLRVGALTINGTFPAFRWSPHLRFAMAMLSCFVWFQVTLGLVAAHEATAVFAMFPQLLVFDLYNVFLAASEAGAAERRYRNGQC
jgi:hypothetical protein